MVDDGESTFEEKTQILYNHVNFGEQSQSWRSRIYPLSLRFAIFPPLGRRTSWRPKLHLGPSAQRKLTRALYEGADRALIVTVNALDDPAGRAHPRVCPSGLIRS